MTSDARRARHEHPCLRARYQRCGPAGPGGRPDRGATDTNVVIPVQALGELFRVLTGKAGWARELAHASISKWQAVYALAPSTPATLASGLELAVAHAFPFWDAMILAAASEAGCRLLLSEDMRDGFAWRGVTITNPLTDTRHSLLARALGA